MVELNIANNQIEFLHENLCNLPASSIINVSNNNLCNEFNFSCITYWGFQNCLNIGEYSTKKEIEIKSNHFQKVRYLSNNFACKEALSKALGLGLAGGVSFKEIQILRDHKGKPYVNLSGKTKKISNKLDIQNIYVSITDTSNLSTAFVIGE